MVHPRPELIFLINPGIMIALGTPQYMIKHDIKPRFTSVRDIKEEDKQFYTPEAWANIQRLKVEDQKKSSEEDHKEDGGDAGVKRD